VEENVKVARDNMLEWWEIFSMTGNIEDARGLIHSTMIYDAALAQEEEIEL